MGRTPKGVVPVAVIEEAGGERKTKNDFLKMRPMEVGVPPVPPTLPREIKTQEMVVVGDPGTVIELSAQLWPRVILPSLRLLLT